VAASTVTAGGPPAAARARLPAGVLTAVPLAAITAAGALLRLWSFSRVGPNPFYDAAVRSMTLSWHNFFFGAFEPGGQVSVDKTPVDLWLQVASVKLFGYSFVTLRVPEVVAGILAIPLLYDLVRRLFGRRAGLGAAAALAVLPAAILTAHSDTMDSLMMLFDVLAAWLVVVGAQQRRVWPVVAAGAALGLAFNVKLFEGLIVLPALVVLALIALDFPWRRKVLALGGGLAAFVVVSLGWIAAASLTPLSGRPWPIGSTNGSIWNVIFVFNGTDRLSGHASAAALAADPPGALRFLRLTDHGYAKTVGTMLVAALVLGAAATAIAIARRRRGAPMNRLMLAGAVFLGTWLVSGVALLSHMQRFQPRYLEAVTPAIAAVVGVGLAELSGLALVAAVAVVAVAAVLVGHPTAWAAIIALGAVAACAVIAASRPRPQRTTALAVFGLVAVLAVPASAAMLVARHHRSDAGLPLQTNSPQLTALSRFLIAHQGGARYEIASPTVARAEPLIIRDARPVLMFTSLHGQSLLDAAQVEHLVATGQVHYAWLGRTACTANGCTGAIRWAIAHAHDVSAAARQPSGTLYRLSTTPKR
jgi:4-amino-4-deoxy-L-arabinose transferase-like glycosyltransferase